MQNGFRLARDATLLETKLKESGVIIDYVDPPNSIQRKEDVSYPLGSNEEAANKKWQSVVDRNFNRCWWDYRGEDAYLGFQKGLDYIVEYIEKNGPYDGIIGFSQGSAMAAIVTNSIHRLLPSHPYFKFSILLSGMAFTEALVPGTSVRYIDNLPEMKEKLKLKDTFEIYFTPPKDLTTEVIVVAGRYDPVVPPLRTQYLASLFEKSVFLEVDGGHYPPKDEESVNTVVKEVVKIIGKSNL